MKKIILVIIILFIILIYGFGKANQPHAKTVSVDAVTGVKPFKQDIYWVDSMVFKKLNF